MAYKTIMDNLLAEFRAVQKIQAQDAQVIKQLSNEEKARLSLVQKLIKAYLAGEPEDVVLGLLGGNGLAKLTATQNGGEIERLYKELKILLEVETIDPNRYKEEAVLAQAKAIREITAEDCKAYQDEFAKLDKKAKKAADYENYKTLNRKLKNLKLGELQHKAKIVLDRSEKLEDWTRKAQAFIDFCTKHSKIINLFGKKEVRFKLLPPEVENLVNEFASLDSVALALEFEQFEFKKIAEAGEVALTFFEMRKDYGAGGSSDLERYSSKTSSGLKTLAKQPSLPNQEDFEYKELDLPLFKTGAKDKDDIDINDISQGSVGNCYALSALGSVALVSPYIIRDMIHPIEGGYKVRFYVKNGKGNLEEIWVHVDNKFPVKNNSLAFAKAADGELWVMVFEKALAKLAGGYKATEGGGSGEILTLITGKAAQTMSADETAWEEIRKRFGVPEPSSYPKSIFKLEAAIGQAVDSNKAIVLYSKINEDLKDINWTALERLETAENGEDIYAVERRYLYYGKHAYIVVDFNFEQDRILLRNPHGALTQANREALIKSFPWAERLSNALFYMTKEEFFRLASSIVL